MSGSNSKPKSVLLCGHSKCGTSWLKRVMQMNPHVRVVDMQFVVPSNEEKLRKIVEYENRVVYFHNPCAVQNPLTLEMLTRIDPNIRAVIIYREPVDAMLSMHNYSRPAYKKRKFGGPNMSTSFSEYISDAKFVESLESGQLYNLYKDEYSYDQNAKNIRKFFKYYKEMLYDWIKEDSNSFLDEFFYFTGIPADFSLPEHPVNRSLAYRSFTLHRVLMKSCLLLTGLDTKQFTIAYQEERLHPSLLRWLMNRNCKDPHFLSHKDRQRLRVVTKPMIERFSKITDLDLSNWGYSS